MLRLVMLPGLVAGALALAAPVSAQDVAPLRFAETEAQLLATFGENASSWVTTLQHFGTWKYGSNFFFVDLAGGDDFDFYRDQLGLYLEVAPVLSLARAGLLPLGKGSVLADVGLTAQINGGWTPEGFPIGRVFLEGVELAWRVPAFAVFNTQILARQEIEYQPSWQFTWVYMLPFSVGRTEWRIQGFLDLWSRRDAQNLDDGLVLLAQPQILVTVLRGVGGGHLQAGVELEPSFNFPVASVHPGRGFAFSPMLRWVF